MAAHAKHFGASNSHRWLHCAASVALEAGVEDRESEYAAEGTAAHELAAAALFEQKPAMAFHGRLFHGHKADENMCANVQVYLDAIELAIGRYSDATLLVEQRVQYGPLIGIDAQETDEGFGTGDVVILAPSASNNPDQPSTIEIHDLKYGRGVQVYAERNPQLMLYALGAYYEHSIAEDWRRFRLCIHQPRLNHFDEWECDLQDLLDFAAEAKASVEVAQRLLADPSKEAIEAAAEPSEDACRFCKAKATCPALTQAVYETTYLPMDDYTNATEDDLALIPLDATVLNNKMSKVGMIEDWCKAIRAEMERRLLAGDTFPDWKLVEGRKGPRKWLDEDIVEKKFKEFRYRKNQMYKFSLVSPAQAEKFVTEGHWTLMRTLITQTEGKPSVAPATDKRPAFTAFDATQQMGDETGADLV